MEKMNGEDINALAEKMQFELIETHISWILLGSDEVYKIKKPLKFSFLDFSTLEKRKNLCEEEVRLNKRLSPEVYIEVVPIVSTNDGMAIEQSGDIVEYAVKMKRLPQEKRMDILLINNNLEKEKIVEIATIIADFHSKVETINDPGYGSSMTVKNQIDDLGNFREVIEKSCEFGKKVDLILERSGKFINENADIFDKRQKHGRIKDCHGDLHSANIFVLEDRTVIFDCIEFSKDFRYIDVASEIAFMAMDLDAFGRYELSEIFVDEYISKTKDTELRTLLNLYKCYRANVRAKIAAIEYSQHPNNEAKKRIEKYVDLAERYAKVL